MLAPVATTGRIGAAERVGAAEMEKTQSIPLRVREGVKRDLEALAEADGLTLAQYLERVLLEHVIQVKRSPAAQQSESGKASRTPSDDGEPDRQK